MADEYIHKSFDGGAQTTALTSGFTAGAATLSVANGTSFPDGSSGPFVVVVDRGLANEEKFLIDTTSGASNVTFTIQQAGYDGTSAVNHNIGATVDHCLDAYTVEQANRYVNLQTTKGSLITHTGTTTAALTASATNNLTLLTDSTTANGIKWGQIVEASIATNAVTDGKIATGVALSKLAPTTPGYVLLGTTTSGVVTGTAISGDITISSAGVAAIASGVIVDADVKSDAAIALSKLATGALPTAITIASGNITANTITSADCKADGASTSIVSIGAALPSATSSKIRFKTTAGAPTSGGAIGDIWFVTA